MAQGSGFLRGLLAGRRRGRPGRIDVRLVVCVDEGTPVLGLEVIPDDVVCPRPSHPVEKHVGPGRKGENPSSEADRIRYVSGGRMKI